MGQNEAIDFETMKRKMKREETKRKIKEGFRNCLHATGDFIMENGTIMIPILIGAGAKVAKDGYRAHKVNQEIRRQECRLYDPRTGDYCETKRPLKSKEKLVMERRYRDDRNAIKSEILKDMGLLKW